MIPKNSNNDGFGDLRGIMEKLDYVKSIGVNSIWLTPIYPSGGKDGGYDITSFVDIDPIYGTMEDFDCLVEKVHEKGMYILVDFVPNHTSDQHEWFKESCKNNDPNNQYRDYYVWYENDDSINPPNNWLSVFGNSAWTYNETRKAWYLHQFLPEQPDLNFRCPDVHREIRNAFVFWIEEKKVDGLRVDALRHLYESENFEDDPPLHTSTNYLHNRELEYDDYVHLNTSDQTETFDLVYEWRCLIDEISKRTKRVKALIGEATYNVRDLGPYHLYKSQPMTHFSFNFQFCSIRQKRPEDPVPPEFDFLTKTERINRSFLPKNVKRLIEEYFSVLPEGCWKNFQMGNHDQIRVGTRLGRENINIANALNLLLGGTAVVYYGEEIGMEEYPRELFHYEMCKDEYGKRHGPSGFRRWTRDPHRTPMQWDSSENAGFTKDGTETYLPVHPNHVEINVERELKDEDSHLQVFRDLVRIRRLPSFQWGQIKLHVINDNVFSFVRFADEEHAEFLVAMNFSDEKTLVNLSGDRVPNKASVFYYSPGGKSVKGMKSENLYNGEKELNDLYQNEARVFMKQIQLNRHDFIIFTWLKKRD